MASAIPLVRAALEDVLSDTVALNGVSITRGDPVEHTPNEAIVFAEAKADRDYAALGTQPTPLAEQVRLSFKAWVIVLGGDFTTAETRLWVIFDAMEAALRSDLSLAGAWLYGRVTSVEQSYALVDKGKAAQVTFVAEGTARI